MKKSIIRTAKITLLALVLSLSLLFSACGKAADGYAMTESQEAPMANGTAMDSAADVEYEMVTEESIAEYDPASGGSANVTQTQKLIQNIYITMTVEHPGDAMEEIIIYAQSTGGYLLYSENYYDEENNNGGASVTVRIPTGTSDQFKAYLEEIGKIDQSSSDSQDVTTQYYDLETRIEQGKAEIEQLTDILNRCNTIEEVLLVREQLSRVQADVESMEGEFRRLKELTRFDTVEIRLEPVYSFVPNDDDDRIMTGNELLDGMANGIRKSFRSVVNGAGYFLIFLAEAFLPLLILAAIAVVIVLIVKKASKKAHQKRMAKYEAQQLAYQQAQQQMQNNSQQ